MFKCKNLFNLKNKNKNKDKDKNNKNLKLSSKEIRKEKAKHNCHGGKTATGRSRARNKSAMNSVDAHVFVNALRRWLDIHGGSIQARELSKFYNSPDCNEIEVPKGGALKLIRKVENSGLLLRHDPKNNQWIIELDKPTLLSELLRMPKLIMNNLIDQPVSGSAPAAARLIAAGGSPPRRDEKASFTVTKTTDTSPESIAPTLKALRAWLGTRPEGRMRSGEIDRFFNAHKELPKPQGIKWLDQYLKQYGMRKRDSGNKSYFFIEVADGSA